MVKETSVAANPQGTMAAYGHFGSPWVYGGVVWGGLIVGGILLWRRLKRPGVPSKGWALVPGCCCVLEAVVPLWFFGIPYSSVSTFVASFFKDLPWLAALYLPPITFGLYVVGAHIGHVLGGFGTVVSGLWRSTSLRLSFESFPGFRLFLRHSYQTIKLPTG